jgi:7,8-dihydropterin-6-yl-methyl-4-(beta-D-ribofuranosyl)aminobenzene 5'-phosphate synthase
LISLILGQTLINQATEVAGKRHSVLMDGGPEPSSIERNVNAMKVPLKDLDAMVLSHWHRDRQCICVSH